MEATPATPEELEALIGQTVTFDGIVLGDGDMIALGLEDGRSIIIAPCMVCGGPEAHLNIAVVSGGDDAGAA